MGVLVGLAKYATPEQEQKDIDISPEE